MILKDLRQNNIMITKPRDIKLPSEKEIFERWSNADGEILVSCICIAYNHSRYIEDCICGMLMQKTNFRFEIIIHDDASTDNTPQIIDNYASKYPRIIKKIIQTENQFSKNKKSLHIAYEKSKGKFIAICEGDDFWCDAEKLQNQVEILNNNDALSCCFHNHLIINDKGEQLNQNKNQNFNSLLSKNDLIKSKKFIKISTLCFKKAFKEFPHEKNFTKNGDVFITSMLGIYGKGYYMGDKFYTIYRKNENSMWTPMPHREKIFNLLVTYYWLAEYHNRRKDFETANFWRAKCLEILIKRGGPFFLNEAIKASKLLEHQT